MDTRESGERKKTAVKDIICTYGTRLVWNSFKSTFNDPSKRNDAVTEDTTCAINLFKFKKLGEETPIFFLHIS